MFKNFNNGKIDLSEQKGGEAKIKNTNIKNENNNNEEEYKASPIAEKAAKASARDIFIYMKPYFTKGNAKRLLIYSIILTVASKGLISMVKRFIKYYLN